MENGTAHLPTIANKPDQAIHPKTMYNTYDRVVKVETTEVIV